jgi:hypothetical protein
MRLRLTMVLTVVLALVFSASAFANSCVNLSRSAPKSASGDELVTKGNWVWVGDAWLFVSPGTNVEEEFGVPGAHLPGENGNYTNGKSGSLLGVSAHCDPEKSTSRQQERGIQTGCH